MKIIEVPFDKLKTVCHMADIHIRLFKRHDEYRKVFKNLYSEIKKVDLKSGIIVIAGDILHSKLDLSPESLDLVSEFLVKLGEMAPTLVIDGNHDLNLSNPNRLRTLYPIINNLQSNNIHYLVKSDIYQVANVQFAHFGITDVPEKWPRPEELTSDIKICLYHGPVYGARTDTNYTVSSRNVDISSFDGFDIVMLGDIHRRQVLQERVKNKNKPIVVYPSSLIQQNHGEPLDGHGFVVWDIPSCKFNFINVLNDFGYYTVILQDGKLNLPKDLPKNLRLRLMHDGADNSALKKALSIIRKQYKVVDISINRLKPSSTVEGKADLGIELADLTDVNVQNSLIKEWIETNHPHLSDNLIETVLEINKETNGLITHSDQSRNVHWRPLEFWFSNLFSYGEGNYINFSKLVGTNGVFAPNASGKSSAMEALIYTLFDKTPRAFRGDHIMNIRKKKFECELKFEVNGTVYGIKRIGKKSVKGPVKVDVEFWRETTSGYKVSLNGEDRFDTNANIRSIVGTYEDFILTTLSGQNGNSLFIDKSHTERKNLLNQFMGVTIFEALEKIANERSKELVGVLKKFSKEDFSEKITTAQSEIETKSGDLIRLQAELDDFVAKSELVQIDIETNSSQKIKVPHFSGDKQSLITQKNSSEKKRSVIQNNNNILDNDVKLVMGKINSIKSQLVNFNEKDLKEKYDEYHLLMSETNKVQHQLTLNSTLVQSKKDNIDQLSRFKYNKDCEVCLENNKSKIKQIEEIDSEISKLVDLVSEFEKKLLAYSKKTSELMEYVEKYNQFLSLTSNLKECESDLHYARESLSKNTSQLKDAENKLILIDDELQKIGQYEDSIKNNKILDENIIELRQKLSELKQKIVTFSNKKLNLHAELKVCENVKSELLINLNEMIKIEEEYEAYRYYLEAIHRDGIPYSIISRTIPFIESEINSVLSQIVPFTIALDIDGKNFGGRIVYDHERTWPLENSSGMERFISSLAIRVALLRSSNLPKSNFLIIDEGFSALDSEYVHSIQMLFDMLKTQFDFLIVISHLDLMRDMVDSLIEVKMEDGFSYINTNS